MTGGLQFYEGNVVKAPDDTLLTINQIHPIYVAFAVPEQYLPEIQERDATADAEGGGDFSKHERAAAAGRIDVH